ncbi:MAG: M55 family metallopeptidase [Actinomycetota bacterium]
MRIYLSADMEGITGLVDAIDVQPGGADYERGRVMMTEDVNAAVRGALAAGATAVTVNDAHGPMRNLLPDLIHPAAALIRGRPKPMGMLEGLSGDFDAAVFIGYHARAGTLGVLSHSFMGHEIEDMWLDDRPAGEIGLTHATAAAFGVPVVAMSGDDAACAEMAAWDPSVTAVAVKEARDRFAAKLLPVAEAREAIEQSVAAAVRARADAGRMVAETAPRTLAIRWQSASAASQLEGIPGVKLRDSRTTEVTGAMPDLFRLLGVFMRAAVAMNGQGPYC